MPMYRAHRVKAGDTIWTAVHHRAHSPATLTPRGTLEFPAGLNMCVHLDCGGNPEETLTDTVGRCKHQTEVTSLGCFCSKATALFIKPLSPCTVYNAFLVFMMTRNTLQIQLTFAPFSGGRDCLPNE